MHSPCARRSHALALAGNSSRPAACRCGHVVQLEVGFLRFRGVEYVAAVGVRCSSSRWVLPDPEAPTAGMSSRRTTRVVSLMHCWGLGNGGEASGGAPGRAHGKAVGCSKAAVAPGGKATKGVGWGGGIPVCLCSHDRHPALAKQFGGQHADARVLPTPLKRAPRCVLPPPL